MVCVCVFETTDLKSPEESVFLLSQQSSLSLSLLSSGSLDFLFPLLQLLLQSRYPLLQRPLTTTGQLCQCVSVSVSVSVCVSVFAILYLRSFSQTQSQSEVVMR